MHITSCHSLLTNDYIILVIPHTVTHAHL